MHRFQPWLLSHPLSPTRKVQTLTFPPPDPTAGTEKAGRRGGGRKTLGNSCRFGVQCARHISFISQSNTRRSPAVHLCTRPSVSLGTNLLAICPCSIQTTLHGTAVGLLFAGLPFQAYCIVFGIFQIKREKEKNVSVCARAVRGFSRGR